MPISIIDSLDQLRAEDWNALIGPDQNPFLRHEFLVNLERHGCVGEHWGWQPRHLALHEASGRLLGAVPQYVKDNSYGELVFDWAWADAYQRSGLRYYPKLVSAVPYSPVTGRRLLIHPEAEHEAVARTLIEAALQEARAGDYSSLHWLFPDQADLKALEAQGFLRRSGLQFHWHNRGYRDFEHFLEGLTAKKRKTIKRERRRVREAGIRIEVLDGHHISEEQWALFNRFYRNTFERLGGYATLNEAFFKAIGKELADQVVLALARDGDEYVAGALSLRSATTLYGRHWGCKADYHSLHFELCYYTGIEYCIAQGLSSFEPGAQGEHKVGRGFEPVPTWSAHWLAHREFSGIIERYLAQEEELMADYRDEMQEHLPFKTGTGGRP